MIIRSIKFKNMLSFGGDKVFEVKNDQSKMEMVIAENGIGKSNLTRILKIAYYFDYPAKIENIVNDFKEEGFIETLTTTRGVDYRCLYEFTRKKLKKVTVWKDGSDEPHDTGNNSSTKAYILQHVTDIPKDVMYNIFIPSIDTFKSFIGMSMEDTRKIRDELFSLTPINNKHESAKKKSNTISSEINELIIKSSVLLESVSEQSIGIEKVEKEVEANLKQKIKDAEIEQTKLISKINIIDSEIDGLTAKANETNKLIEVINKVENREKSITINNDIASVKETIEGLEETMINNNRLLSEHEKYDRFVKVEKLGFEKRECLDALLETQQNISEINDLIVDVKNHNSYVDYQKKVNEYNKIVVQCGEQTTRNGLFADSVDTKKESAISHHSKMMSLKKEVDVLKLGDKCPTCGSDMNYDESVYKSKLELLSSYNKEYSKLKEEYEKESSTLRGYEKELISLNIKKDSLSNDINNHNGKDVISKNPKESIDECDGKRITLLKLMADTERKVNVLSGSIKQLEDDGISNEKPHTNREDIGKKDEETKKMVSEHKESLYKYNRELNDLGEICTETKEKPKETKQELIGVLSNIEVETRTKEDTLTKYMVEKDTLKSKLDDLKSKKDSESLNHMKETLKSSLERHSVLNTSISKKHEELRKYQMLSYVFSESGVKNWILNKIKLSFASSINTDLSKFSLSVGFDDNFLLTIYKDGRELSQRLMSVGQKKIIDTIMCLNFIELYSKKLPEMNTIILDECLSSLSKPNADKLLQTVRNKTVYNGFNVKITNHAPIDNNIIDNIIVLKEIYGYTEIVK